MTEAPPNEEILREAALREELTGRKGTDTYKVNYLVEAGAGAGKTYILVNRIINQLLSGTATPDTLAAITFTEKATQEMVDRIDRELLARLKDTAAERGQESPEAETIRALIDGIDQMQISTIHSFCRTLLTTMPFESELGPEFEVTDDPAQPADAFFELQIREHPERFTAVREATGIGFDLLKENFQRVCESRGELRYEATDGTRLNQKLDAVRTQAGNLYTLLQEKGSIDNVKNKTSKTVEKQMPKIREVLRLKSGPRDAFVQAVLEVCNPCTEKRSIDAEAIARVLPGNVKDNREQVGRIWDRITGIRGEILHSFSMELFCRLLPEYRKYKRQQKIATQQDLLCCARDMLRTSAEARKYFHQKYACIYVDEMQDTDPIQAQILFYLTTDEKDFDAEDWRNCKPTPGSLFLVGDPKQAIYRFRGADITVYKTLETLFQNGVGSVRHLHFNYRSASEITDFSDSVFRDILTGGAYQASYSAMTAVSGSAEQAGVIAYHSEKSSDPGQVAAFIAETVAQKAAVGTKETLHEAGYADFMILTNTKARTEAYVQALSEYGIPCNMSGAKKYSEIPQLVRGNTLLQYLTDPEEETKLAAVLNRCYQIPFPKIREYRQRTGNLTADPKAVRAALSETEETERFAEFFPAMEETERLRRQAASQPALTVAENLWLNSCAVWQGEEAENRTGAYSMVLQFLHELRDCGGSLTALAEKAEEMLNGTADRELLLQDETNCVRIMNLHKAKGLEAEIVILACDSPFRTEAEKHAEYIGNRELLYLCLTKASGFGGRRILAKPVGWDEGPGREEKEFLEAQAVRLAYVAATRAKTGLVICGGEKNTWALPAERLEAQEERKVSWPESTLEALNSGRASVNPAESAEPETAEIDPAEMEKKLSGKAEELSGLRHLDISPSMLEEKENFDGQKGEPAGRAAEEKDGTDLPHGAVWGTIVHRLMELCVRRQEFRPEQRKRLAEQAVYESLNGEEPDDTERERLDPKHSCRTTEALAERLITEAVRQTAFLEDPGQEIRKLLDAGKAYTELPFETEILPEDPLREACRAVAGETGELSIMMKGVIDLAVRTGQGWVLIDYKTDSVRQGEAQEAYGKRLKKQYEPQLMIYREILNRLSLGPVEMTAICAVSLGGKLIRLE